MKLKKISKKSESFDCECIECGHELSSETHCKDIKCPECGGQMRRKARPGPGQKTQTAVKRRFGDTSVDVREVDGQVRVIESNPTPVQITHTAELYEREENGETLTGLSFSSEDPVLRYGEAEILLHRDGAADFSRLLNVGAVLKNHDPNLIVGVPTKVWIDDRHRGNMLMRWGTTTIALEAKKEALVDKTLRGVSVGYAVREWIYLRNNNETYQGFSGPAWIAVKWDALEGSLTPIAADPSVGLERVVEIRQKAKAKTTKNKGTTMKKIKLLRAWEASDGKSYDAGVEMEVDERTFAELTEGEKPVAEAVTETEQRTEVKPLALAPKTEVPAKDEPKTDYREEARTAVREEMKKESQRVAGIRTMCRRFEMPPEVATELIEGEKGMEEAQRTVLDKIADQSRDQAPRGSITLTKDSRDSFRSAATDSLILRSGVTPIEKPADGAEDLRGRSLLRMAEECLIRANLKVPQDIRAMVSLALNMRGSETITGSTSDFPLILAATANKSLMAGYEVAASTFQFWARTGSLNDFKAATRLKFSDVGKLKLVPENQHYTETKRTEKKETIQLGTYARMWTMSRQGIINDDIGAFTTTLFGFGVEAKMLPNDLAIAVLTANAAMTDGFDLFSTQHANYGTLTARRLDTLAHAQDALKYMRGLMAKQKQYQQAEEAETARYLNLRPKIWLVNADNEYYARQTIASATDASQTNPGVENPFKNLGITVVSEQNIQTDDTDYSHYIFADPRIAAVVEVAFLQGNQMPYTEELDQTDTDGRKWLCRLDCGAAAVDHQGGVKELGTT